MRRGFLPAWLARRLDPEARYGLRLTLFAVAVVLVVVPLFTLWMQVTSEGPLTRVDVQVSEQFHEAVLASRLLEHFFTAISFLGDPPVVYTAAFLAALFFWRRGSRRVAVYLVSTNLLGGAINWTVKGIVTRARPVLDEPIGQASGYSFPSGHTVAATVGFGSLLLAFMPLIPRRLRVPSIAAYLLMVALVAASRLGLVVHYLSDVLAGFVLGLAWLSLSTAAFSIWAAERGRGGVGMTDGLEPEPDPLGTSAPERR